LSGLGKIQLAHFTNFLGEIGDSPLAIISFQAELAWSLAHRFTKVTREGALIREAVVQGNVANC
jgi:hypothetical protein